MARLKTMLTKIRPKTNNGRPTVPYSPIPPDTITEGYQLAAMGSGTLVKVRALKAALGQLKAKVDGLDNIDPAVNMAFAAITANVDTAIDQMKDAIQTATTMLNTDPAP